MKHYVLIVTIDLKCMQKKCHYTNTVKIMYLVAKGSNKTHSLTHFICALHIYNDEPSHTFSLMMTLLSQLYLH